MTRAIVSNPAQRIPPASIVARLMNACTELVLGSLSFLVGIAAAMGFSALGMLTQPMLIGPFTLAVTGLSYFAIEQVLGRAQGEESAPLLPQPRPVLKSLGIALAAVLLAQMGAYAIAWVQAEVVGVEATEQAAIMELVESGDRAKLVLLGISAIVLAPLTEELLFRHMFFRRLLHSAGPWLAFGLSAVAFSVFHFNPTGFVIYVWLGAVFASAYLLSGRLWIAMLVHAAYNATAFFELLRLSS